MSIIRFTPADIMKVKNLEPGWYKAKVTKIEGPKPAKDGASVNIVVTIQIAETGKEIDNYYNSKLIGMMIPLIEATSGKKVDASNPIEIDTEGILHKELDVKLGMKEFDGQLRNEIQEMLPLGRGTSAAAF